MCVAVEVDRMLPGQAPCSVNVVRDSFLALQGA